MGLALTSYEIIEQVNQGYHEHVSKTITDFSDLNEGKGLC